MIITIKVWISNRGWLDLGGMIRSAPFFLYQGLIMAKKKKYQPKKTDQQNLKELKELTKTIDDKIKKISDTYKKWWDKDKGSWKKGYKG